MSTSKDKSIYRWVKASERLPSVKSRDLYFTRTLNVYYDVCKLQEDGFVQTGYGGKHLSSIYDNYTLNEIEWLEKVEADQHELWDSFCDDLNDWQNETSMDVEDIIIKELSSKYFITPNQ